MQVDQSTCTCTKFWTNMWWFRWIMWIWFCVIDLSEDLLPIRDSRDTSLCLNSVSKTPRIITEWNSLPDSITSYWLRYHPSEASCLLTLLYRARRHAHFIAAISTRSLAIIIQVQIQTVLVHDYLSSQSFLSQNFSMYYHHHHYHLWFFV